MTYTSEIGRKFWYEFDHSTKYNSDFMNVVMKAGAGTVQTVFSDTRAAGTYPAEFTRFVRPNKDSWLLLADAQTNAVKQFLNGDWAYMQSAFEDFGQGVLNDMDPERAANNDRIHTMDVQGAGPPIGYHRWHASIRAIQLVGIGDSSWWERLDELVGLAWAIQSFARPKQQAMPNASIPPKDMQDLRQAWLGMQPDRRDRQYDLTGDIGYHPSPKQPAQ